jgi:hypothetical protein
MNRIIRETLVIALGALSVVYLLNPTAGFIELIPDNVPIVGNLDEAGAVLILMNTLRYYGIDPNRLWGQRHQAPDDDQTYDADEVQPGEWR